MIRLWAFALVLLLSGCLSASLRQAESTNQETAGGADQYTAATDAPVVPVNSAVENSAGEVKSLSESTGQAGVPHENPLSPAAEGSKEEVVVDPETRDDIRLLSSETDELVPEDEGTTVAPEEVTFDFPVVENEKVRYFIDYYTGPGKRTFRRWLQRSGRYIPLMKKIFAEEGLPLDLTYLAMVESGFNVKAYSWAHAVGPWQFIEMTGLGYGLEQNWWLDERRDFEKSTRAAARFLKDLHSRFDGDWYLSVAAYNAGGGKISQAIRKYKTRDFWELSRGKFLKAETKNYVPKLLAVLLIAKEPEKYGFTNLEYYEPLEYDVVNIPTTTDLEVVANLCCASYEDIKKLNPELKRWCTPPGQKDYKLRIPKGDVDAFAAKYAKLAEHERANYKRHRIKSGDTLGALAKKYGIRVNDIITLNNIKNPRALRINTDLILPLKKGYTSRPLDELEDDYLRTRRKTYTVRNGDSLWKIARRFDVSEKNLRVWNRLGWSNMIKPGQVLIVSSKAVAAKNRAKKNMPVKKIVYQVRPGDTLWDIGKQFEVDFRQILNWNNLPKGHVLRPGDKLTLLVKKTTKG